LRSHTVKDGDDFRVIVEIPAVERDLLNVGVGRVIKESRNGRDLERALRLASNGGRAVKEEKRWTCEKTDPTEKRKRAYKRTEGA
jgi:hypothetical protein